MNIFNVFVADDTAFTWVWRCAFYPFLVFNNIGALIYMHWGAAFALSTTAVTMEQMKMMIHATVIWLAAPFILMLYGLLWRIFVGTTTGDWD